MFSENVKQSDQQRIQKLSMTPAQRKLAKKHGTPAEFAVAVYKYVPGDISMDEVRVALEKYNQEREAAGPRSKAGRATGQCLRCCCNG